MNGEILGSVLFSSEIKSKWPHFFFKSAQTRIPGKSAYLKIVFLNQNLCYGNSKEPSHRDRSFEHTKHMFKLMGMKILQYRVKNLTYGTMLKLIGWWKLHKCRWVYYRNGNFQYSKGLYSESRHKPELLPFCSLHCLSHDARYIVSWAF